MPTYTFVPNSGSSEAHTGAIPRVLSIAGTDPTGGAGIQADIKAITAAGGFAYSVTTALVAQNTTGVQDIHTPPVDFLKTQLHSVASDVAIDAVKIGMLGTAEITAAVKEFVAGIPCPVVLDPVMIASSGDRLLDSDAEAAVLDLAQHADLLTPNLPELAVLCGSETAETKEQAIAQATTLAAQLQAHVLVKGGHFASGPADNALVSPTGEVTDVPVHRVDTKNTHGTGCSLSSAIATRLAGGHCPADAVRWASRWLHEAILNADALGIGQGHGPVDHSHTARRMVRQASPSTWAPSTSAPTAPILPPAGPYTQQLWEHTAGYLTDTLNLPFIQQLGAGTLRKEDFLFYLHQDSLYLGKYAIALTQLGGQWAADAHDAIAAEQGMQDSWLKGRQPATMSRVTQGYTDFLLASVFSRESAVGQAAVLPCYWLYYEVGAHLEAANHAAHPYHDWLATYGGEEFKASVTGAIARVEEAIAASPELFEDALHAFDLASRFEVEFFAQADTAWVVER